MNMNEVDYGGLFYTINPEVVYNRSSLYTEERLGINS